MIKATCEADANPAKGLIRGGEGRWRWSTNLPSHCQNGNTQHVLVGWWQSRGKGREKRGVDTYVHEEVVLIARLGASGCAQAIWCQFGATKNRKRGWHEPSTGSLLVPSQDRPRQFMANKTFQCEECVRVWEFNPPALGFERTELVHQPM